MIQDKKIVAENQLNKQLTELETMPQREVDRVIIHDLHGLPVKRHEGTVYKDPRDDPALGSLGRDFLHSGTRPTSNVVDNVIGGQPIGTVETHPVGGVMATEGVIDEGPDGQKKKGFFTKMKDKYHNWRERRRQKKLAREQGEPVSPLSPSPTNQQLGTIMDPTLADIKKTGSWDFPDQRMVTTQTTLREAPMMANMPANVGGITQITQTELKSGILHPGLIQDFALKPQTEFLVSQAAATVQQTQNQIINVQPLPQVQMHAQPGMVIDDLTRPAKNLMEGVSGAYGLAANPFQPINDEGIHKLDRRLIKDPGAIEPRGVGVDNLHHHQTGISSPGFVNTNLTNVGLSSPGFSNVHQHMPVYNETIERNVFTSQQTKNQPMQVIQEIPPSYISSASNVNEPFAVPPRPDTQFADLQAELIKKGAIKPTETILSVTPMTVEPGMAGDLANKLREGRLLTGNELEKLNANLHGSSS